MESFEEFLRRWQAQAAANSGQTAGNFPPPSEPRTYGAPGGVMGDLSHVLRGLGPVAARAIMAPVDVLGAIPGVSDANRYFFGNRRDQVGPRGPLPGNVTPPPTAAPQTPAPETVGSRGGSVMSNGSGGGSGSGTDNSFWAAPTFTPPEQARLNPAIAAAQEKMREQIAGLQAEIRPQGWGGRSDIWGQVLNRLQSGLLDYGQRSNWGDVAAGVQRDMGMEEQARQEAARLGLKLPELDMQMAAMQQGVDDTNRTANNSFTARKDEVTYADGRDRSQEGRRRTESDRSYGLQREGVALQREGISRADANQKRTEDMIALQIAQAFGGPQADRMLINRGFGEGTPAADSVMRTRVLGAVRGITSDNRGVRALNQMLAQGGSGIKIKNSRDTASIVAATNWLQSNPTYLDAMAGILGYGEAPQAVRK